MIYQDVIQAVDGLSVDEVRQLREYLRQKEEQSQLRAGTLNVEALLNGLKILSEGLSDDAFSEIERAMNEEFVEPLDADS